MIVMCVQFFVGLGSSPTTTGTSLEQNRKKKQKKQLEKKNTHTHTKKFKKNEKILIFEAFKKKNQNSVFFLKFLRFFECSASSHIEGTCSSYT